MYINTHSSIVLKAPKVGTTQITINSAWVNNPRSSNTLEESSAMKGRDALAHATMWVNPEDITLSGRCQPQKVTYCRIHLHETPRIGKSIETKS